MDKQEKMRNEAARAIRRLARANLRKVRCDSVGWVRKSVGVVEQQFSMRETHGPPSDWLRGLTIAVVGARTLPGLDRT